MSAPWVDFPSAARDLGQKLQALTGGNLDIEAWQGWLQEHGLPDLNAAIGKLKNPTQDDWDDLREFLLHPDQKKYMEKIRDACKKRDWGKMLDLIQERVGYFTQQAGLPNPDPEERGPPILYPYSWIPHTGAFIWPKVKTTITAPSTMMLFASEPVESDLGEIGAGEVAYMVFTQPGSYKFSTPTKTKIINVLPSTEAIPVMNYFNSVAPTTRYPNWQQIVNVNPGDRVVMPMGGETQLAWQEYDGVPGLQQGSSPGEFHVQHPGNYWVHNPNNADQWIMIHGNGPRRTTVVPWPMPNAPELTVTAPTALRFIHFGNKKAGLKSYLEDGNATIDVLQPQTTGFDQHYWCEVPGTYQFSDPVSGWTMNVHAKDPRFMVEDGLRVYVNQPVMLGKEQWMYPGSKGIFEDQVSWSTPGTYTIVPRERYATATITVLPRPHHCWYGHNLLQELRKIAPFDWSPGYMEFWCVHLRRHVLRRRVTRRLFGKHKNVEIMDFQLQDGEWNQLYDVLRNHSRRQLLQYPAIAQSYLSRVQLPPHIQSALTSKPSLINVLHNYVSEDGSFNYNGWIKS